MFIPGIHQIIILALIFVISACNGVGTAKLDGVAVGAGASNSADPSFVFSGIALIDEISDSSLKIHWTAHPDAIAYDIYDSTSSNLIYIKTVIGQSSDQVTLNGLIPGTSYEFRVRARTVSETDNNIKDISVTLNSAPESPTTIALVSPMISPGNLDTPIIRVGGVKAGDTVKLYSVACKTLVASGVATGSTIDLTSSTVALGSFVYHASSMNSALASSSCSVASVGYTRAAFSAGYVYSDGSCVLSFAGATSVTNKTDSTLTLNWSSHADAVAYDIFNTTSGTPVIVTTVWNQASTQVNLTGLVPNAMYKFRVRLKNSIGQNDYNTNDLSVTMNSAPDAPTGITLISPSSSPSSSSTASFRVSGVKAGDTIKIFSNNTCTTQLASGVASSSTIDLTSSSLVDGTYAIYAKATNQNSSASACSSASGSYQKITCPTGYIVVKGHASLGTSNFCVMQFEAKSISGMATSQATSTPWVSISQTNARNACTALGAKYDLISNPEWMTLAHEIEATATNWTGGSVGSGILFRGHSDNNPASALAVTISTDPYVGTSNSSTQAVGSGKEQKRTLVLTNDEVVWDLVGNVMEWQDWSPGGGLDLAPTTCSASWEELPTLNCAALSAADYLPANPAGITAANYNSTYGLGIFYGGSGGASLRGGAWNTITYGTYPGLFMLTLNEVSSSAYTSIGFRCVYRP